MHNLSSVSLDPDELMDRSELTSTLTGGGGVSESLGRGVIENLTSAFKLKL